MGKLWYTPLLTIGIRLRFSFMLRPPVPTGEKKTGNACVIWSDVSPFTLFPTWGRVYVWRTPKEVYNPKYLVPTVKHGGGSVMVWAATSWYSVGFIITLHGRITAKEYVGRLGNQGHPMIQTLFPTTMPPFTQTGTVKSLFEEREGELQHLPDQHNYQIWTSLNHSGRFWRQHWGTDSHLQHL
jgi:hypothetical protein